MKNNTPDIKGRTIIVVDIIGDGPTFGELDAIAGTWHMISMARGKWAVHPSEVEHILDEIRKVLLPYSKNGNNGAPVTK